MPYHVLLRLLPFHKSLRFARDFKAAFRARDNAILRDRMSRISKPEAKRMTFAEVYQNFYEK